MNKYDLEINLEIVLSCLKDYIIRIPNFETSS